MRTVRSWRRGRTGCALRVQDRLLLEAEDLGALGLELGHLLEGEPAVLVALGLLARLLLSLLVRQVAQRLEDLEYGDCTT